MAKDTYPLSSSWLRAATYDDETRTLVVTTEQGRSYAFSLVPPDVVEEFVGSSSPGQFFHSVLKGYGR